MNLEEALQKLFSLHQFGMKFGLESITNLLAQIGNPHHKLKSIHIAGSNGKGSTASFISSIIREAGFNVGLYTSPHFVRFNERIRINGIEIEDDYVLNFICDLNDYIDRNKITFFEITTALALKYFADKHVDYAVIETGLGGRLDATNVINPISSVITSISLEHTEILGDTIEKIAFEKGGIIKSGIDVFIGVLPQKAEEVIADIALANNSKLCYLKERIKAEEENLFVKAGDKNYKIYSAPLIGVHQKKNAALALIVCKEAIPGISWINITKGINRVKENSGIEGRYEVFNQNPRIIFDSAHNPEGLETFLDEYRKEYARYSNRVLIFAAMKDKDIASMLKMASPMFNKIYISKVSYERAASVTELFAIANSQGVEASFLENPAEFISRFRESDPQSSLVVLGSMYLLGEIKNRLIKEKT